MPSPPSELNCLLSFPAFLQCYGLDPLPRWRSHLSTFVASKTQAPCSLLTAFWQPSFPPHVSPGSSPVGDPAAQTLMLTLTPCHFSHSHSRSDQETHDGWNVLAPMPCSLCIEDTNRGGREAWGVNSAINSKMAEPWWSLCWITPTPSLTGKMGLQSFSWFVISSLSTLSSGNSLESRVPVLGWFPLHLIEPSAWVWVSRCLVGCWDQIRSPEESLWLLLAVFFFCSQVNRDGCRAGRLSSLFSAASLCPVFQLPEDKCVCSKGTDWEI